MGVYNDVIFTDAVDHVRRLLETENTDELADIIEMVAPIPDLVMACMLLLTLKARGTDISEITGIDLSHTKPTTQDLVLPPGVHL